MPDAPIDDEAVDAPDGDESEAEDETEAIAAGISECELELRYFEAGAEFLSGKEVFLGCTITEPSSALGELDDDVKSAMNLLAIEVCRRMARIMRNDLPTSPTPGKAADLA